VCGVNGLIYTLATGRRRRREIKARNLPSIAHG
jgi:hypothetical protein